MTIMSDAAGIIGHGSPSDYALSPVEHAEQLRTSAPKLAVLLTSSAPVELARQYAEADTEARVAERTFKRWVIRANWAVLATATVSALLMAVALLAGNLGGLTQTVLILLALIGVAAGGTASMSLFRVKEGRLLGVPSSGAVTSGLGLARHRARLVARRLGTLGRRVGGCPVTQIKPSAVCAWRSAPAV
jgi:hypothetical protein